MKKRFTDEQIIGFLKQAAGGTPIKELCRKHGFSDASFYLWRRKFGGLEVPDTKWLRTEARKRVQISKVSKSSEGAKLIKSADKIANLRDIISSPPANWSLARKREYFDWAKKVVDGLRGTNARLERKFDSLYRKRP